jgi:hypothetical protein
MSSGQKQLWWWEKTVEYAFVRHVMGDNAASPMSGKPEKWLGDLVEKVEDKFRLIEFKRTSDASSENKKYGGKNYIETCSDLPNKDTAAHWLVFGAENEAKFQLKYRRYLENPDKDKSLTNSGDMSTMEFAAFIEYIAALMLKREWKEGEASGGLVMAGVGDNQMTVLDLSEFIHFIPALEAKLAPALDGALTPQR